MRHQLLALPLLLACGNTTNTDSALDLACDDIGLDIPDGRGESAGVWDAARQRLVFFGGNEAVPVNCAPGATDFTGQTWSYKAACEAFVKLQADGAPSKRGRHIAALDANRERMIVHGGRFRDGDSGDYTLYGDTWAFDFKTDTWAKLKGPGSGPSERGNHSGIIVDDTLWVFGGNDSANGAVFAPMNDLWAFDLTTEKWTETTTTNPPPPRLYQAMAADADHLYIYGGGDENALFGTGFYGDLWSLDLGTLKWTELHPGGAGAPLGRIWGALAHDAANERLVMFSGHDEGALGNTNELWTFNLGNDSWKQQSAGDQFSAPANGQCDFPADFTTIDDSAPERRDASVNAPTGDGQLVIFGGKTDCGNSNDVWSLDLDNLAWSEWSRATEGEVCLRAFQDCTTMCF
jgi:hypothetical protein